MLGFLIISTFVTVLSFVGTGSCAGIQGATMANFTELTSPVSTTSDSKLSKGGFSRTRLFISTYPATFYQAQEYCYQIAGSFLSILDRQSDDYVRQTLLVNGLTYGSNIWTSGRFDYTRYIWLGAGQPIQYSNWAPGHPFGNYGYATCVSIRATGYLSYQYGWTTNSCGNSYRFICEI